MRLEIAGRAYAFRRLSRTKIFSSAFVLILALALGINVSIVAAINTYVFRPIFGNSGKNLRIAYTEWTKFGWDFPPVPVPLKDVTSVASSGWFDSARANLSINGRVFSNLQVAHADYGLFKTLSVQPILGRWPSPPKRLSTAPEAILSYQLWKTLGVENSRILGITVSMDGRNYKIVGVMPPGFGFPTRDTAIWATFLRDPAIVGNAGQQQSNSWQVLKLHKGTSPRHLETALNAQLASALRNASGKVQTEASEDGWKLRTSTLNSWFGADAATNLIYMQWGALLVLVLALVSLLNLSADRYLARQHEMSIRFVLGANSLAIAANASAEALILGSAASAIAICVSYFFRNVFNLFSIATAATPFRIVVPSWEWAAIPIAGIGLSMSCILLPHAIAALRRHFSSKSQRAIIGADLSPVLVNLRRVFSVIQISMTLIMLVVALLLSVSLYNKAANVEGISINKKLVLSVSLSSTAYPTATARTSVWRALERKIDHDPAIASFSLGNGIPFTELSQTAAFSPSKDNQASTIGFLIEGDAHLAPNLGVKLLAGRFLTKNDLPGQDHVIVIDKALANSVFGTPEVVGKSLYFNNDEWRVVGVVARIGDEYTAFGSKGTAFVPGPPLSSDRMGFLITLPPAVRTPTLAIREIRSLVGSTLGSNGVYSLDTMRQLVTSSANDAIGLTALFAAFALSAILAAGIGIYALVDLATRRRRREYALKRALGCTDLQLQWKVIRGSLALLALSLIPGVAGALIATRLLSATFYDVTSIVPLIFLAVVFFLFVLILAASWIPARRVCTDDISTTLAS